MDDVAMVMVMVAMVVVAGTRVRGHGEHRQHGRDGDELGEGHGELLSSRVNRPELDRGGIMPQNETPRHDGHRAGAGMR
jgi:hypothetical protein